MKKNYKTKRRSAWLTLVLLMIMALPVNAQNVGDRFQVDNGYWYEVVDAQKKTVKVTWANSSAATAQATQQVLESETADLPDEWKGYNGAVPTTGKEEYILETYFNDKTPEAETKHNIPVVVIPSTVKYNNKDWTVVAVGSYAFINERGFGNVELPEKIEAIEDAAFYQCSVTMMNFPASLKYIGWRAFYKTNLAPYRIEKKGNNKKFIYRKYSDQPIKILGATAIGPQAFEGNFSKSKFECPNITFVGYQAFKGDKFNITTPIPATAKIGEQPEDNKIKAMYNNLPAGTDQRSGVESFAEYSYDLTSFNTRKTAVTPTLAEGPTTIPAGMFEKAFIEKEHFFIPLSVTTIEERAFANAGIKSYNDLSVVTKIGARAFENGVMSGDFVIGEQVEEIGDGAFAGNTKLAGFTLKGSDNCKVGAGILEGCPELEFIDLRNMNSADAKSKLKNLSREFNSGTITAGLSTHTLVFLPEAQGITIAAGQDVNFVRSDGKCTKLSLQDGAEYEFLCDITANEVVYNRCNMTLKKETIDRGYNEGLTISHYEGDNSLASYRDFSPFASGKNCFTIFLPYAVTLPPGIRAYNLDFQTKRDTGKKNNFGLPITEEVYVFKSIPDGSTLEANRPYLLRVTDGGDHGSQEFNAINSPVEIAASGNDKYDKIYGGRLKPKFFTPGETDQSFVFTGSTEKVPRVTPLADWHYNPWTLGRDQNGNDVWKRMPDKTGFGKLIPPFRGMIMLKPTSSTANEFVLLDEDNQTTGINDVTNDADAQQGAQRIYTMDGRYVGTNFDSLPSGMYIIKGNKTFKTK